MSDQPTIDPREKMMRDGLAVFAQRVAQVHHSMGYWDDAESPEDVDISNVLAAIHRGVSKAYDTYTRGGDPRIVMFMDPVSGKPAPVGRGIPMGFPADMADVIFDCIGLLRLLGVNVVEVLTTVAEGQIVVGEMPEDQLLPQGSPEAPPQVQTKK